MQNLKTKIEYLMLAVIFASVIDSVFSGFYIQQYHTLLVAAGAGVLLVSCVLTDRFPKVIFCYVIFIVMIPVLCSNELMNGFRIINNKMADALNHSMDLGFYYYVSVDLNHSRADSVLAVVFFFLCASLLISFMRKKPLVLFLLTACLELGILIIAPYSISSVFFLFLGAWFAYYNFRKNRIRFGSVMCFLFFVSAVGLSFYDQKTAINDTPVKKAILLQVRTMVQGKGYQATGGIGNGEIAGIGAVSPAGTRLFDVESSDGQTMYLKGYVSGNYREKAWRKEENQTLIMAGEPAQGLPFLFPELRMNELLGAKGQGIFAEDTQLTICYRKKQDTYLMVPYFSDVNGIEGAVPGETSSFRTGGKNEYHIRYYPISDVNRMMNLSGKVHRKVLRGLGDSPAEENYFRAMEQYTNYVKEHNLEVPKEIRKDIEKIYKEIAPGNHVSDKIKGVTDYLKEHYQYTYRPGLTPEGTDPILFFLKDSKKGFCTQYASAAVMLLRTGGIPARYVEGYRVDETQWKTGKAAVTDYDAHAWAEVYLENIGWIPVDVTGQYTGKAAYQSVTQKEKTQNREMFGTGQMVQSVKTIVIFTVFVLLIFFFRIVSKILQKKYRWKQLSNREKVLDYEKQWKWLRKANGFVREKEGTAERIMKEIIEKAKYSPYDISDEEVMLVARHIQVLKKNTRNVTKILNIMIKS